ncbi:hypothetical protein AAG747_21415 [Rapidithrix thailandica]|uniref:Salivary lipocalin n=1 Tax=Rapidithrix thailandica TaxID=413964 RepID=A0AAW9S9D0_9BACT
MNLNIFKTISFVIVLIVCIKTEVLTNAWHILTASDFSIPEESSVFTFKVTRMNEGSGEWWLYGEDENYYYTMERTKAENPYAIISKSKARTCAHFNKLDYTTWCE